MCSETIVWLDVLYIVKSPLSIVCLPLQNVEYRKCGVPFRDPTGLGMPLRASLYPPDMFTSESFCLVEQLINLNVGRPSKCACAKKSGARFHGDCWYCEYDGELKTCLTPLNERKAPNTSTRCAPAKAAGAVIHIDILPDQSDDERPSAGWSSDGEKPGDLAFWFPDDDDWAFRSSAKTRTLKTSNGSDYHRKRFRPSVD